MPVQMKFLVIADPHASDRPPMGRHEGYREQILTKLQECAKITHKQKITVTLLTGDVFHQPRANLVSHRLVQELQAVFDSFNGQIFAAVGNHDEGEEGFVSLYRQPLGVLEKSESLTILREPTWPPGFPLFLVGRHFNSQRDLDPSYYTLTDEERESGPIVMLAHGSILPANRETPFPYVPLQKLDLSGIALLINGHVHDGHGLHKLDDTFYLNPGSIGRTSRRDLKEKRWPTVWIVKWDGKDFTFDEIGLKSALAPEEVFIEQSSAEGGDDDEIRAFVERVEKGLALEEASLEELLKDVPKNIQPLVRHYIEEAGGL